MKEDLTFSLQRPLKLCIPYLLVLEYFCKKIRMKSGIKEVYDKNGQISS